MSEIIDYSEVYDVNTKVGKLTVIGFHTPTSEVLDHNFHGKFLNNKYMKFLSCDIGIAPFAPRTVDPLQVGSEAGKMHPQEIANPYLFTTVTGESFNRLCNVIYSPAPETKQGSSVDVHDVKPSVGTSPDIRLDDKVYYALMMDDRFRKALPQQGMFVNHVVPKVRNLMVTRPMGENATMQSTINKGDGTIRNPSAPGTTPKDTDSSHLIEEGVTNEWETLTLLSSDFPVPMPSVPTIQVIASNSSDAINTDSHYDIIAPVVPKVYCGILILPPAWQVSQYYRITVTWHVMFHTFRPSCEVGNLSSRELFRRLNHDSDGSESGVNDVYYNFEEVPGEDAVRLASVPVPKEAPMLDAFESDTVERLSTEVRM